MTVNRIGEGEERAKETGLTPEEFEIAREEVIAALLSDLESEKQLKWEIVIGNREISYAELIEEVRQGTELGQWLVKLHFKAKKRQGLMRASVERIFRSLNEYEDNK